MRPHMIVLTLHVLSFLLFGNNPLQAAEDWTVPAIDLAPITGHPALACTPTELARLRGASSSDGPNRPVVSSILAAADRAIKVAPVFPPRGGQHNQWYQCDACQIGLRTLDDTHHQCPTCKKVYTGEPYDDVIYSRKHGRNLQNMVTAAWAYAITQKPEYADFAKAVLLGYAQRYVHYPYHSASRASDTWSSRSGGHLFEQTLNEAATFSQTIGPAYDLIHDWEGLTPTDHAQIRDGLLLPMLQNIARNAAGKSNWQTWHNAAFLWGGGLLEDESWVRRAIVDPKNGFAYQMNVSVTDDGMWYENSWGYHFYTLSAMIEIAETARRLNIDLWSHPSLKKMFTVALGYVMPNGRFPRFGDDTDTSISRAAHYFEFAYHAYRDPAMLPYLPTRPSRESILFGRKPNTRQDLPALSSRLFPGAGHAILRTRGKAELAAAITFGPYGGFHGHLDKLSFVLFGLDKELGYDPGRARSQAYRLPVHRDWYKATISHNTVVVDQAPQQPAAGQLKFFAVTPEYATVVADCHDAYPGVSQRRLLCLTPSYLLVFDSLHSETPHRYDWIYHNQGTGVDCSVADQTVDRLADNYPGQEYLQHLRQGRTKEPIHIRFLDDVCTTHLRLAAASAATLQPTGMTVTIGDGVGASMKDRIPLAMATREGSSALFAAVIEPVSEGDSAQVSAVDLQSGEGTFQIHVMRGDQMDAVTIFSDGRVEMTAAGKTIPLQAE